jgi:hypothetical protein
MAFPRWPVAPVVRTGGPSGLDSGRYSGATGCHPIFALILPATYVFCLLLIDAALKRPAGVANSSVQDVSTFAQRYRRMLFFQNEMLRSCLPKSLFGHAQTFLSAQWCFILTNNFRA